MEEWWALTLVLLCSSSWMSSAHGFEDGSGESAGEYPLTTKNPVIYRMHVTSDIAYRFATTHVTSLLGNRDPVAREIVFKVTLPAAAFISNFTMEIEGKIYNSQVKEKASARRDYETAKEKGESAAQVIAGKTPVTEFQVSVNVAAEAKVNFNLTYQEFLQRRLGLYEHVIDIKPGQVVRDLQVRVRIMESRSLTLLKVPPLTDVNSIEAINELAQINWSGGSNAFVTYSPTIEEQIAASQDGVSGQFAVQYDVQRDLDAGEIQVVDGYFVHYFAPAGLKPVPKNVVFILDVSGSMSGDKIEQTKEAMDTILTDLEEHDMFNIIVFSARVSVWKDSLPLIPATLKNVKRAKRFTRQMTANGDTNINDALLTGINLLKTKSDASEPPEAGTRTNMIIFLSDGEPTHGVLDAESILNNVRQANEDHVTLFSLAFGQGADFSLLQKVSLQNRGLARRIYANADAALQLKGFYQEVSRPVLSEVQLSYLGDAIDEESLTESDFGTFFQGSELVVAGRLKDSNISNMLSQISAESATGVVLLGIDVNVVETEKMLKAEDLSSLTERLWAYLSIKKLLDDTIGEVEASAREVARQKALDLSLKYGFVTPLTSMVVTQPEKPQRRQPDPGNRGMDSRQSPSFAKKQRPANVPGRSSSASDTSRRTGFSKSVVDPQTGFREEAAHPIRRWLQDMDPIWMRPGFRHYSRWNQHMAMMHWPMAPSRMDYHYLYGFRRRAETQRPATPTTPANTPTKSFLVSDTGRRAGVLQSMFDPQTGITVEGQVVDSEVFNKTSPWVRVGRYFRQVDIKRQNATISVTSTEVLINGQLEVRLRQLHDTLTIHGTNTTVKIRRKGVIVDMGNDIIFLVERRARKPSRRGKQNYLGLCIKDGGGVSPAAQGLIGQFHRNLHVKPQGLSTPLPPGRPSRPAHRRRRKQGRRRN